MGSRFLCLGRRCSERKTGRLFRIGRKDNKEVMTKLILEADPEYNIIYNSTKMYAYVPDRYKKGKL